MLQHMVNLSSLVILCSLWSTLALNNSKPPKKIPVDSPTTPQANYTFLTILDDQYGVRNVSYFTIDGLAIIDADVVYGRVEDLLANKLVPHDKGKHRRASSVYPGSGGTWPKANITYRYTSDATESSVSSVVNDAISRWVKGAPYLTFFKLPNAPKADNGVLTISSNVCGGCQASIGYANSPRFMNLQPSCKEPGKTPGPCVVDETTHEFGHVLGLFHEHQRPDREQFVHYECDNLRAGCTTIAADQTCCDDDVPDGCCSARGNYNIHSATSVDAAGTYDVRSLMHYRRDAFANPGTDTLTPVDTWVLIPNNNPGWPSKRDYGRICKLYRSACPLAVSCGELDCPVKCVKINQCKKPGLCENLTERPPCCDAVTVNAECERHKKFCEQQGCDVLIN